MNLNTKKILFILVIFIIVIGVITSTYAYSYKGTGFSHNISDSQYSNLSTSDILNKYEDTNYSAEVTGKCYKIIDGDTICVEGVGKVRLVGVNTPEKGVEGYSVSKHFVSKLCKDKEVSLDIDNSKEHDKYNRTLAVVIVNGKNLNEILLDEGLAETMYILPSEFNSNDWNN